MIDLPHNTLLPHSRYIIPLPQGKPANIFIVEDGEGNPTEILCSVGKVGTHMAGYGTTIARMLSVIVRETSLDEAIGVMSTLALDLAESHAAPYEDQLCRSLSEAFAIALRKYRASKQGVER